MMKRRFIRTDNKLFLGVYINRYSKTILQGIAVIILIAFALIVSFWYIIIPLVFIYIFFIEPYQKKKKLELYRQMAKEGKVLYNDEWMKKNDAKKQFEIDKKQESWRGYQLTCSCGYVWNTRKGTGLPAICPSCHTKFDVMLEKYDRYLDPKM